MWVRSDLAWRRVPFKHSATAPLLKTHHLTPHFHSTKISYRNPNTMAVAFAENKTRAMKPKVLAIHVPECFEFEFLKLPAELRLCIYEFVASDHNCSCHLELKSIIVGCKNERQPPLSQTCRQIRHELLPVYYGNSTIILNVSAVKGIRIQCGDGQASLPFLDESRRWLKAVGQQNLSLIKRVGIAGVLQVTGSDPIGGSNVGRARRTTFQSNIALTPRALLCVYSLPGGSDFSEDLELLQEDILTLFNERSKTSGPRVWSKYSFWADLLDIFEQVGYWDLRVEGSTKSAIDNPSFVKWKCSLASPHKQLEELNGDNE